MSVDPDDYLWDRTGEPDALVESLEAKLAPLRRREAPPDWEHAAISGEGQGRSWPLRGLPPRMLVTLAALAASLLAVLGVVRWWPPSSGRGGSGWQVEAVAGAPRLGETPAAKGARLRAGESLITGPGERARLRLAGVGEVELWPHSSLRLLQSGRERQLLALDRGVLAAAITSRPQLFEVATPHGRAVDLGCYFTLEVLPDGRERLRVEAGWVALRRDGREAFVPGGAAVVSRPGELGLPIYLDAPELRQALDRWSATPEEDERAGRLAAALALARRQDALTLWHLLAATRGAERLAVFDRLAALAPPPAGVSREGIAAGDAGMRDRWWESLGLGAAHWWRGWRVSYPVPSR